MQVPLARRLLRICTCLAAALATAPLEVHGGAVPEERARAAAGRVDRVVIGVARQSGGNNVNVMRREAASSRGRESSLPASSLGGDADGVPPENDEKAEDDETNVVGKQPLVGTGDELDEEMHLKDMPIMGPHDDPNYYDVPLEDQALPDFPTDFPPEVSDVEEDDETETKAKLTEVKRASRNASKSEELPANEDSEDDSQDPEHEAAVARLAKLAAAVDARNGAARGSQDAQSAAGASASVPRQQQEDGAAAELQASGKSRAEGRQGRGAADSDRIWPFDSTKTEKLGSSSVVAPTHSLPTMSKDSGASSSATSTTSTSATGTGATAVIINGVKSSSPLSEACAGLDVKAYCNDRADSLVAIVDSYGKDQCACNCYPGLNPKMPLYTGLQCESNNCASLVSCGTHGTARPYTSLASKHELCTCDCPAGRELIREGTLIPSCDLPYHQCDYLQDSGEACAEWKAEGYCVGDAKSWGFNWTCLRCAATCRENLARIR